MAADLEEKQLLLPKKKASWELSSRHTLAVMAFFGFFNVYCMRVNLSVALVAMVSSSNTSTNTTNSKECPEMDKSNSTASSSSKGEFEWDESTQGLILGAFFYGYITTQLPGGWLAEQIGGKKLFGYGVLGTAILTLLTPLAARWSLGAFLAIRVLEGIGEGVTFPAMHVLWSNWAPLWERSRLVAFTYAGAQLGTVFAMPLSGLLCDYGFAGGWPSVFYVFGALACVWVLVWMLLAHDHPHEHPRISAEEQKYIESSLGRRAAVSTPWKEIFTSTAVWAIVVGHFSNNWGFYSMLTCLPLYMKRILKFDMQQNGALSALPYAVLWFMQTASGFIADFLRQKGYLSTQNTRKLLMTIGLLTPAGLLVAASYAGCDHLPAVVLLTIGLGMGGLCMGGYNVNHLDIAPRFAGTLMGISNGFATIPGFAGPQLVGVLTNGNDTMIQWRKFFFITAGIYVLGTIFYLIFGQGSEQSWSNGKEFYNQERNVVINHSSSSTSLKEKEDESCVS